jgi:hypothetical protein
MMLEADGVGWSAPSAVRAAIVELCILLSALEVYLWTDNRRVLDRPWRHALVALVVVAAAALLARRPPTLSELGLARRSWNANVALLGLWTIIGMAICGVIGAAAGAIGDAPSVVRWIARNWHIDVSQQVLLQVALVPRLATIARGNGRGVSATAATIFSLLHAPNVILMGLTAIAGFVWCEWNRRRPNLIALALSHAALAAAALYCLNGPLLRSLRVGIGYVFYAG